MRLYRPGKIDGLESESGRQPRGHMPVDVGPQASRSAKGPGSGPNFCADAVHPWTGRHPSISDQLTLQRQGSLDEPPWVGESLDTFGAVGIVDDELIGVGIGDP